MNFFFFVDDLRFFLCLGGPSMIASTSRRTSEFSCVPFNVSIVEAVEEFVPSTMSSFFVLDSLAVDLACGVWEPCVVGRVDAASMFLSCLHGWVSVLGVFLLQSRFYPKLCAYFLVTLYSKHDLFSLMFCLVKRRMNY